MRREFQVKFRSTLDVSLALELGAEPLGSVTEADTYCSGDGSIRIRDAGGKILVTHKENRRDAAFRIKAVLSEKIVSREAADALMRERGVRCTVFKTRTIFRLGNALIVADEVEGLGDFVEIRAEGEDEVRRVAERIGLSADEAIHTSYADMMALRALPKWRALVARLHSRVGELTFGITSGILTTLGVLGGVNAATESKLSVVAAIAAIAVADSASDAFGIYMAKSAERGVGSGAAIRYAVGTLAGKFFFPLTFIIPIFLLPLDAAVAVDYLWGGCALALLSFEQAIVQERSPAAHICRNLALAAAIVAFSTAVGWMVARFGGA